MKTVPRQQFDQDIAAIGKGARKTPDLRTRNTESQCLASIGLSERAGDNTLQEYNNFA